MIDNNTINQQEEFSNSPIEDYTPNEILNLGYDDDYVQKVDEDYLNMLTQLAPKVNSFTGSPRVKNNNLAVSQPPEQTVDPSKPMRLDEVFADMPGNVNEQGDYKPRQDYVEDTQNFGMRETNFDRFYAHPKFADLGWHPYRDNEKLYNENSSWGDDWSRMSGQFMSNMLPAFSPFGILDFTMDPDTDGATKMADAMRVGTSSKEGFGASFTNFSLNSAYTVGIISSIAVEELALWGATAALAVATPATGGASAAAAAATAALAVERAAVGANKLRNVAKWANRFADATALTRGIKAGNDMLRGLKNADKAKDFWTGLKTGKSTLGRIFAPETMRALRTFETTKDVGNGIYKIGKRATAFGGFYRDIRSVNLALDESRLEAGFAYNELIANGVNVEKQRSPNGILTDEQLQSINENAIKGAHTSIMANAPILYLSNRIVLGSALGGINPSLKRVFGEQLGSLGNDVLQKTKRVIDKTGKRTTDVFEKKLSKYTPKGISQRIKSYTVGGSTIAGAHGALRFFSANLGEGVQELYQEALSHGITDYYTEILKDPSQNSKLLMDASFEDAVESQMNMQGFETFMSGFMMGGPMSVFSKVIFEGGPNLFNRAANSEQFKEAKIKRDNAIDNLVKVRNENWNKAGKNESVFDQSNLNFIKVRQAAAGQNKSAYNQDKFGFQDNKDFVEFTHLHHLASSDSIGPLKDQLSGLASLSDEALLEAFPEYKEDVSNGKLRKRLENFSSKADVIEKEYNSLNDKIENKYDPSKFNKNSREYIDELSKYQAVEHAKYLRMFTSQAFNDSVKRLASISNELASDNLVYTQVGGSAIKISKMASSDLRILLDPETLRQELGILEQGITTLKESKGDNTLIKNKEARFKALSDYYKVLTAKENQTKTQKKEGGGKFDARKINKLEPVFKAYVEHLANVEDAYVDRDKLKSTLRKMVDYGELQYRTKMYDKAAEVLNDQGVLDEIVSKTSEYMKNKYAEDRIKLKENIKRAADKQLISDVLKEIDNLNIVPDPDEVGDFIATGDINSLTVFNDENGRLSMVDSSEKFMDLNRIFNNYRKLTNPEEVVEGDGLDLTESLDSAESVEEGTTDNIINNDPNKNPYAKQTLRRKYREYTAAKINEGKTPLSDTEWFKTKEALAIANGLNKLKAMWVEELNPALSDRDIIIKNDKGFGSWIQDNQDNPDVRDIINESYLSFEFLLEKKQTTESLGDGVKIISEENGIRLVERKTSNGVYYNITDLNNQPLLDAYYSQAGVADVKGNYGKASEAKNIFNKLVKSVPDTGVFEFAGQSMQYGDIVTDKTNRKYVVLGTPGKVKTGGKLFILPFDEIEKHDTVSKKEKASIRLSPTEFSSQYKVEGVTFKDVSVNDNTARLISKNIIGIFPMGITRAKGVEIIDVLLKNLTPAEASDMSVSVSKNPVVVPTAPRFFKAANKSDNKLITLKPETHTFRLSVSNDITADKINTILAELGLDSLENLDIIIPSGNLEFTDGNPFNFTDQEADKYFAFKNQALRAIAKQQVLRNKLLDILGDGDSVTVKLSDVVDAIDISYEFSEVDDSFSNNLADLEHSTYDGEVIIIDNFTRYNAITGERDRALNYITNYTPESVEARNLRDKVEDDLLSTNQLNGKNLIDYLKTERSFDRYHAVIKLPNGKIIFAPLKSDSILKEQQEETYTRLLDQAAITRKDNLTEEGVVKKKEFNDKFNDELNSEFYISLKGGFKGELRVTPNGGIAIRYLNIETDTLLNTTFFANEQTQSQFKSFNDLVNALDIMTNNPNSPDTNKLGFKLTTDSFKRSFPETTLADGVVENTVTNLNPSLFKNLNIEFSFANNEVDNYIASQKIASQLNDNVDTTSFDKWSEILDKATPNELDTIIDQIDKAGEMTPNLMDMIGVKREGFKNGIQPTQQTTEVEAEAEASPQTSEVETLEEQLKQAKAKLKVYHQTLESKKDSGEITTVEYIQATAMKKDAEFAKLTGEVSQLERQINNAHGFKIASDDFTASDVEAIDNFIKWAKDNLPGYIQIGDIKDVANRLKVKGTPIGLFAMHLNNISGGVDVGGTMYVGEKGYRYHEAFHAVFRLLLSDVEITKYLTIAKKEVRVKLKNEGKNFRLELEKFRNTSESYASMSEARLEQEYLEEYLADEFEKFKANPKSSNTSGVIKSLFNRLVEWIKSVFNRYDKNELRNLFEKMDAGKYKSAGSIENRFTQSFKTGVTVEAYKLLPYEKIKLDRGYANKYLDPSTTDLLIRQITSSYLDRVKRILPGQSREAILIETIQDFQAYHDPFDKRNAGRSGAEITELINRFKALGGVLDGSNSEEIEHAVDFMGKTMNVVLEYISLFDQKIQNEKYLTDQFEENEGLRNVADWDKDQSMIGGFSSLPMALRAYIGTTTLLSSENTFGDVLPSGLRLHVPVDFITAYNGLLKGVKNNTDEVEFLRSLISFSKGNLQTKSVVERMLNDIGIDEEIILNSKRGDIMKSIKNTSFFMEIFKGFENFKVDYLFVHTNTNSNTTESNSKVLLYDAANRDDANTQIDVWKQSYSELYNEIKGNSKLLNKATDSLIALSGFLDNIGDKMSDKKIDSKAQELSDGIYNSLGIRLSPAYVSFSIISNLTNISGSNYQQTILNNNKQAEPISSEALVEIVNQIKVSEGSNRMAGYLFSKKGTGVRGRLQKLAKSNAMFDELIGQTVFLNPEGNFVYAHQMGTLHLKKIYGLNDASNLDAAKKKDNGYNVTNVLLNSPAFLAMAEQDQLKVLRVAGIKESSLNETNESVLDENAGVALDKNGKTYGSLTRSEFTAMSINAYLANYQQLSQQNKKIEFVDPDTGEILDTALAPVLIRVLEASNTGDMMSLPVIRTVELNEKGSVKLTTEAIDLFTEEINREFQRIQREAATPRDQRTPIDGYNAVDGNLTFGNKGRAFEFSDSDYLLASQNNSSNQLEAKDPRLSDAIAYRVVKGTQKFAYVSKKAGMSIGLTREGTTSRSPVKIKSGRSSKSFGLKALGLVQVNENNIKGIIESMGEGISKTKTKNFIYAIQVGDATFYVENKVTREFLNGDVKRYGYELTDTNAKQILVQPTTQTSEVEMFNGLPVINSNKIVNSEGKEGAARFEKGQILVNRKLLKTKFEEKSWTNMRELVETIDGKKTTSRAENLPEDQFKTYEEFEGFVLAHEYVHSIYTREEFIKDVNGSTKGDYETEINRRALENIESLKALEAAEEAMVGGMMAKSEMNEALDLKTLLETIAKEDPNVTLEQALKDDRINMSMSEFKSTLERRLIDDYMNFALDLESGRIEQKLSSDIINGFADDSGIENGDAAMTELNLIRNNQDYNLMQIYFNNWLNTKAINQLIYGDQAKSLKNAIDKIKRAKLSNASYISAGSSLFDKSKGVNHKTKDILGVLFTDPTFDKTYDDGKGERADAQMYITTKALRHMLFGFGTLDNAKVDLLNKIEKGEYIDADLFWGYIDNNKNRIEGYKSLGAIFNSLKLVYSDGDTALKMSAVVLTPELTSRITGRDTDGNPIYEAKEQARPLHNLRLKLEKLQVENPKAIAIAYPQSASKMMKKNAISQEDVFGDNLFADIKPSLLDADYMGLQMINPSNKTEITDPTQLKALITSELNDKEIVYINGEKFDLATLRKKYNLLSKTKLNNKYFNKVNLIANFSIEGAMRELRTSKKTGELTIELDEFKDFAVESLKASGAASNTIEFFVKDLNYDLNNPLVQRQFEQLFLAYFTKGTISEKISGDALALMSDHGIRVVRRVFSVDENGVPDKFSVIRDTIYNRNPLPIELKSDDNGNLEGLASLLEASNGEGIIISDVLRHNIKEYDKSGNYTGIRYTEGLRAANSAEASIIEEGSMSMEDVISKAFAVRIPSQDKHSASSVKFIDFLPIYYGSTAIFSKELIEISGADFDIDKVYVHTKEFYKDSVTGKLIEYGINGRSGKEKGFDDYIHYINEKVKSKKSSYSKASEKYDRSTLNDKQKYTNAELVKAKENKLSKESFRALKLLGLPITLSEYVEHVKVKGEPYDAALANQLLDYKFAMWGNESNTVKSKEGKNPIAYDAADIKALTEVWDYIKENLPELAEEVDGNMGDVDSLYGQGKAFGNNKEGAASIGKIVLPNLFLNLLGEHNISIRDIKIAGVETLPQIKFNGIKFNEFNAQYEKIKVNGEIIAGQRTQYIISALITAMTDNAKERLASKLGLNKDALNLVGMYSKLGVPIRTSILLVSNPIIKDEYFAANNKISKTDPGIASRIKSLVRELEFDNKGIKQNQQEVTDEMLQRHINNDIDLNNANQKEVFEIYSILKQFQTGHGIKSHINELSSVMNLTKGFGQNFSDMDRTNNSLKKLGIEMSNEEFKKTSFPVDVRSLFKSDLWQSNLVDVFKHFKDVLLPQVFLTRTPGFVQMQEVVLENLRKDEYLMDEDVKYQISNDLLSFLTIKAYMKDLESKGAMTSLASLNNEILYPQSNSEFNIHSLITSLRKQYPDNYFLNVLIYNERADDLDNVTGMHNAVSNTFGKKKDIDKIRAQAAFMEIFGENKIDAMHLIHYMMVKDGFQYSSGSLIEAVTPAVLDNFSTSIENVFGIMKAERHGEIFKKKFGNTYNGLINEFVYGYSKSNRNNVYLNTIYGTPFYSALYRETSLSNVKITKELVASNPNKMYVFAENQNQVGTTGDAVIRGLENARPLTLMYDLATYYDAVDLSEFANRLDFEISEILNSGKEIILPEFLLSKNKMKKLKAESPDVFDYLDEKLRSEFGYILTDNGSGYVTLEEGSVKKLSSIESKPAYIVKETNETILHVNLKNDLRGSLGKYGFTLKTETIKGKKVKTLNLPAVVKNVAYDKNENGFVTSTRAETFELIEVTNPYKGESEYFLDADNPIASGVSAKYKLTESKGSNYQHQNGFMFDTVSFERPSYKEVREYVSDDARGLVDDAFDNEDVAVSSYIDNKVRVEEAGFEIEIESGSAYAYVERGRVLISELVDSDFTSEAVESVIEQTDEIIDQNETDYTEDVDQNAGDAFDVNDIFGTLEETLEEKYPRIVKWWDNNIQNNPENLSKLAAEEQIANLEQLLKQRDDPEQSYETDVEFIDHLKSCIL